MSYRRLQLSRFFYFFIIGLFYLYWGFLTFKVPCLGFSMIWNLDKFFILSTSNIHNRLVCAFVRMCVWCVCCTSVWFVLYACVFVFICVCVCALCVLCYVVCVCMCVILYACVTSTLIFQRTMLILRLFKVTL